MSHLMLSTIQHAQPNFTGKQKLLDVMILGNETQDLRAHVVNELINHIEEYCDSGKSLPTANMTIF